MAEINEQCLGIPLTLPDNYRSIEFARPNQIVSHDISSQRKTIFDLIDPNKDNPASDEIVKDVLSTADEMINDVQERFAYWLLG